MMITKWIEFKVRPESVDAFRAELAQLERESRRENGCTYYAAFEVADQPGMFTVLESWETSAALEAHRRAPHMAAFKEMCESMILKKSALSLDAMALD